jgi:single-strand DNA-binding protein
MQTRSWDDKDGQKKYRTEIVADRIQFGPRSGGSSSGGEKFAPKKEEKEEVGGGAIEYPEEQINPDDIPF